ncbi:MAG TPA: hypothetical protein VE650_11630 [Acetobacteraceae bacterium]|nr:hypothetical protein [Acetobacteraceae bacterium]
MRVALTVLLLATGLPGLVGAEEPHRAAADIVTKTGKERLADKAGDEQRVDDCKVPEARRTRPRPTACPGDKSD